jgi:hypothetical protein
VLCCAHPASIQGQPLYPRLRQGMNHTALPRHRSLSFVVICRYISHISSPPRLLTEEPSRRRRSILILSRQSRHATRTNPYPSDPLRHHHIIAVCVLYPH